MDFLYKSLETLHGVLGVLWIIMIVWFLSAVRAYGSIPDDAHAIRLRVSGIGIRALGGLAIVMGIILAATIKSLGSSFNFDSMAGIFLSVGIIFAVISYVYINEGKVMRMVKGMTKELYPSLLKWTYFELLFAFLTIVFMVIGAQI